MKKINTISLLSILLFFASCGNNVCEKTIEKLALTENGSVGISLGDQVSVVAEKIGNVDPAKYSGYWVNEINEKRFFDGVKAHVIATFPRLWLTGEYEGTYIWQDDYTGDYGVSRLMLSVSCDRDSNEDLDGKRVELYEAICEHYRKHHIVKESDDTSTLFQIESPNMSTEETRENLIFVAQDVDNNSVVIIIDRK